MEGEEVSITGDGHWRGRKSLPQGMDIGRGGSLYHRGWTLVGEEVSVTVDGHWRGSKSLSQGMDIGEGGSLYHRGWTLENGGGGSLYHRGWTLEGEEVSITQGEGGGVYSSLSS